MSISIGLLGQSDSSSAFRCGFSGLEPISIKKTVKRFGLRLTSISWKFENRDNDFIKGYPDYVQFLNNSVMQKIQIPSRLDPTVFSRMFTKMSIEAFEKDTELKSALEKAEGETRISKSLLDFIAFLRKRYENERYTSIANKTKMFESSNLPFSFFTDLVMFNETYAGFLDAVHRKTSLYQNVWLHKYVDDGRRFKTKFEEMKSSLQPLFDAAEQSSFLQKCLSTLILVSNCDDVDSFNSLKFVDAKKVDSKQFNQLLNEFKASLDHYASTILSIEPNTFSKMPKTDLNRIFAQILVQ